MGTYKIFVITQLMTILGGSTAITTDVIEFITKEDALYAVECLNTYSQGVHATPLFRPLDDKS